MKQEILDKADLDPYFALTREGDYRLSYQSNSKVYHQEGVAGEPVRVIEFFKTRAERESKILEIQSEILQSLSASVRADVMQIYALMTEHNVSPGMTDSAELSGIERSALRNVQALYNGLSGEGKTAVRKLNGILKFTSASDIRGKMDMSNISQDALIRKLFDIFEANEPRRPPNADTDAVAQATYTRNKEIYDNQRDNFIDAMLTAMP